MKSVIPPYIAHKFIELTKTKSVFLNCELIEASENSVSGMISNMQRIHKLSVPHARHTDKRVNWKGCLWWKCTEKRKGVYSTAEHSSEQVWCWQTCRPNSPSEDLHREMSFLIVSWRYVYFAMFLDFIIHCFVFLITGICLNISVIT